MPEETKKISPVAAELKRLKEKLNSLELEKKEKPEIKEKIEKKIEETEKKIEELKEKKEEEKKKKKKVVSGFIKYWQDVKAGKKKTPWEIHKERMKEKERQKKEEVKSENKTPDKEAEKIKEKLEKIPETEFLKSEEPKEEPKEEKKEEKPKEGFDIKKFLQKNDTWILVLGIVLIIWVGIKLLGGKGSSTQTTAEIKKEAEPQVEWEEVNIAPPGAPPRYIRRTK
jgi:hypothetical protein